MQKLIALTALIVISAFAEESAADPLGVLPKKVADAWHEKYAGAKVLRVTDSNKEFQIKASDELNANFAVTLDAEGTLVEQSTRKVTARGVPGSTTRFMLSMPYLEWENGQIFTGKARGERLVYLLHIYKSHPMLFWFTESGDFLYVQRIRNPEERKIADNDLAEVREPVATEIALSLNKAGQIVFDGQTYGDDEFEKKLVDKYGKTRFNVRLNASDVSSKRKVEVINLLQKQHMKKITTVPPVDEEK